MFDWGSFFAGMALDTVILSVVIALLGPWMIERWVYSRAFEVFKDFMADPRMNEIIQTYVVKRLWGNAGGRPPSIGGAIKGGIAQLIMNGIGNLMAKKPGAHEALETTGRVIEEYPLAPP